MTRKKMKSFIKPLDEHTPKELMRFTKQELIEYVKGMVKRNQNQTRMLEDEYRSSRKATNEANYTKKLNIQLSNQLSSATINADSFKNSRGKAISELNIVRRELRVEEGLNVQLRKDVDFLTFEGKRLANTIRAEQVIVAEQVIDIDRLRTERKEFFSLAIKGGKL